MKKELGFLYADYEEFKPKTFKGFIIDLPNGKKIKFKNKSPILAYKKVLEYFKKGNHPSIVFSSSVDNFLMDYNNRKLSNLVYPPGEIRDNDSSLINKIVKSKKFK